jgi:hypothetical protein
MCFVTGLQNNKQKRWKLFLPLIQEQTFQIAQETFVTQKEKVLGQEKRPPTWPQLQITQQQTFPQEERPSTRCQLQIA